MAQVQRAAFTYAQRTLHYTKGEAQRFADYVVRKYERGSRRTLEQHARKFAYYEELCNTFA